MLQDIKKRSAAEAALIRRAWSDQEFKSTLLSDPTSAYAAELANAGSALPEDTEVRAVEESNNVLYLVIPKVNIDPQTKVKLDERSTRADFEAALILRALADAGFKDQLTTDPKAAYEAQLATVREGARLPEDLQIRLVEESENVVYFRLPQPPPQGGEMSEDELERVAGGVVAVGVAIASTVVVGAVAAAVLLYQDEQFASSGSTVT